MKKVIVLLLLSMLAVGMVGCKKTAEEDIYDTTPSTAIDSEAVSDDTAPETDQETEDTEAIKTETPTEAEEASQTPIENQEDATVSEDVYDSDNSVEVVDKDEVEVVSVPASIEDPEFNTALMSFLDPIYYNVFFGQGDYVEGITEEAMTKFAISYVYQHEYNELKFDTTSFILYIPEDRVEELVKQYFDFSVTGHHSFEEENVMYMDGFYLMPAVDTTWTESFSIEEVTQSGDFSYDVIMQIMSEGGETFRYKASVEVRDQRFVLVGYVKVQDTAESEPKEETESTEGTVTE